ncbi:hypothetical protein EYF80_045059 [Liparis tanakae]|uniref:Uncharacterized protein n=1 Tax=Liparis tanakae TaxID=230148 RepID=A0A4Z2FUD5_9TELE|nr:hypothetical protein EYF80_045059 [Liparis tanakae]
MKHQQESWVLALFNSTSGRRVSDSDGAERPRCVVPHILPLCAPRGSRSSLCLLPSTFSPPGAVLLHLSSSVSPLIISSCQAEPLVEPSCVGSDSRQI